MEEKELPNVPVIEKEFKPKNLKRRSFYFETNEKHFLLIMVLFFIAFIVGTFNFSKINDTKGVVPADYVTVSDSVKIASHDLYFANSSLSKGIIKEKSYYIFNTLDDNVLSETFYIPEEKTKVYISDSNFVDIYEETVVRHNYNKYLKRYETTEQTEYFYNIYITPQEINNLGVIYSEGRTFSNFVIFPYFFYYF